MKTLTLTGDDNTPAMPMTEAQVNHLRRLLAWMRCEMGQEPAEMVAMTGEIIEKLGGPDAITDKEGARQRLQAGYEKSASYPAYIRQAVKMLTKALHAHERAAGIVEEARDSAK